MSKENKVVDKEKWLEECFEEYIRVGSFSLVQVRDGIKAHQEKLNNGSKALVLKINPETIKNFGKNVEITDNMDNYLAIAIINSNTEQMKSSIVVEGSKTFLPLIATAAEIIGSALIGGVVGRVVTIGAIFIAEVTISAIKKKCWNAIAERLWYNLSIIVIMQLNLMTWKLVKLLISNVTKFLTT